MGCGYQEKTQHFLSPCCFPGWGAKWHGNMLFHSTLQQRCHKAIWR